MIHFEVARQLRAKGKTIPILMLTVRDSNTDIVEGRDGSIEFSDGPECNVADWRLQGQERYLKGAELCWSVYASYREGWDDDLCEFCGRKFANARGGILLEGYRTLDGYHWVSKDCYEDFKSLFEWKVVQCPNSSAESR